jgi:hypothetical protein
MLRIPEITRVKSIVHESSNINIAVANVGVIFDVDGKT